jgi:hypothetical protein
MPNCSDMGFQQAHCSCTTQGLSEMHMSCVSQLQHVHYNASELSFASDRRKPCPSQRTLSLKVGEQRTAAQRTQLWQPPCAGRATAGHPHLLSGRLTPACEHHVQVRHGAAEIQSLCVTPKVRIRSKYLRHLGGVRHCCSKRGSPWSCSRCRCTCALRPCATASQVSATTL